MRSIIKLLLGFILINVLHVFDPSGKYLVWGQTKHKQKQSPQHYSLSVIITSTGPIPEHIYVPLGKKVHFYVTGLSEEPSCVLIPEVNLFLAANKGQISEGEAIFDHPGDVHFYCPTDHTRGTITIIEEIPVIYDEGLAGKGTAGEEFSGEWDEDKAASRWVPREE